MRFSLSKLTLPGNYTVALTISDKNENQPKTSNAYPFYISVVTNLTNKAVDDFIYDVKQGNITNPDEAYNRLVN